MDKTIYSRRSECVQRMLVTLREKAGFTQRELAAKLHRERSFVSRLEQGERRLDLAEFFAVCQACGVDATKEAARLMRQFKIL